MERIMSEGLENEADFDVEINSIVSDMNEEEDVKTTEDKEGEDLLLAEIDAFRNKAAQLQQLINAKEDKAAELEALVKEKEAENTELQDQLYKKREEANSIVTDVETQVDKMLSSLRESMDNIEIQINCLVNQNNDSLKASLEEFNSSVSAITDRMNEISDDLSEKNHSESVHLYRLLQDELSEHDKAEALASQSDGHFKSLKALTVVVLVFSILGMAVGVVSLLISLGIIRF